jgi:2-iminobutanoate/2-iminopropanoate deaminase
MAGETISTENAPGAIGPYSQAVKLGNLLFTAGQIPLDPATGQIVEGDIQAQTERVMQNVVAILEAAGTSIDNVVKTTCFLTDLGNFAAFNEVYARYMGSNRPARSTVQVAALPAGALVEVESVAECS